MRCRAQTYKGEQCRNQSDPGSIYCHAHIKQKTFVFDKKANDRARAELKAYNKRKKQWSRRYPEEIFPEPWPDSSYTMVCGARTRKGTPCRRTDIYVNGRCLLHGGLSTGPKTEKGLKKVIRNLPWVKNNTKL